MTTEANKDITITNGYDRSGYSDQEPPEDYDPGSADAFFDEKEYEYGF